MEMGFRWRKLAVVSDSKTFWKGGNEVVLNVNF